MSLQNVAQKGDAYDMGAVEADGELILQDGFEG